MEISVVIPTYNRAKFLKKNLPYLINQHYPKTKFEILICDDGSNDQTKAIVEKFAHKTRLPCLSYLSQTNQGPAVARNLGIRQAKGKIIAFTDDDCQPDRNWLAEIEKSFQENPKIAGVGGVTYAKKHQATPLTYQVENAYEDCFPTCNVAYSKKILKKNRGFDKNFSRVNEDADLSWRLGRVNQIIHNPKMRVLHLPRQTTFFKELQAIRYLESEFMLCEKMPAIYRQKRGNPYRQVLYWYGLRTGAKKIINDSPWIFKNPLIFLQSLALIVCQRLYLIILTPGFIVRHHQRSHHH